MMTFEPSFTFSAMRSGLPFAFMSATAATRHGLGSMGFASDSPLYAAPFIFHIVTVPAPAYQKTVGATTTALDVTPVMLVKPSSTAAWGARGRSFGLTG